MYVIINDIRKTAYNKRCYLSDRGRTVLASPLVVEVDLSVQSMHAVSRFKSVSSYLTYV